MLPGSGSPISVGSGGRGMHPMETRASTSSSKTGQLWV